MNVESFSCIHTCNIFCASCSTYCCMSYIIIATYDVTFFLLKLCWPTLKLCVKNRYQYVAINSYIIMYMYRFTIIAIYIGFQTAEKP